MLNKREKEKLETLQVKYEQIEKAIKTVELELGIKRSSDG